MHAILTYEQGDTVDDGVAADEHLCYAVTGVDRRVGNERAIGGQSCKEIETGGGYINYYVCDLMTASCRLGAQLKAHG